MSLSQPDLQHQHVSVHLQLFSRQLGDLVFKSRDLVALLGNLAFEAVDLGHHITLLMNVAATCGTMALP
jgi:hypothetical protein